MDMKNYINHLRGIISIPLLVAGFFACAQTSQPATLGSPGSNCQVTVNFSQICKGGSTVLTASGANAYIWSPSYGLSDTTGNTVTASPDVSTSYTVIGTSSNGCTSYAGTNVIVSEGPKIDAGNDITILLNSSEEIVASGGIFYNWSPSIGLSCTDCPDPIASPSITTEYCVKVTDINNCMDSTCLKVHVETPCSANMDMTVPNAFSPNNDGSNDVMVLHGWNECIASFTFVVYDRLGEKVFESDDPLKTWDGSYKGNPLDPAVYVYFIEATFATNEKFSKKGNISLMR